ncbi:MAG: response regulator [Desulfobacteraceae bacterium]|nr:MAG: response regulator [Desulfobacteraceae bacterium]
MKAMEQDINCLNFKGLIDYVQQRFGQDGLERLLDGVVGNPDFIVPKKDDPEVFEPIGIKHLVDPSYWISNEVSLILLNNITRAVPGPEPGYQAGLGAILDSLSKTDLFLSKVVGPKVLARKAAKINSKFNRTKDVRVDSIENNLGRITLHYKPGYRVTKDVCNWNLGIYAGLTRATGAKLVSARETRCVVDGDECCEFQIRWRSASFIKRLLRSVLRLFTRDLINEHEQIVSERDQLIVNLSESEKQYRQLIENSADGVCIVQDGKITYSNSRFFELTKISVDELNEESFINRIHPEDRDRIIRGYHNRVTGQDVPNRTVVRAFDREHQEHVVEINSSLIDWKGAPAVLNFVRDITRQHHLEQQLRQSHKMEAVGTLSGGIAHEFNNILGIILGNAELGIEDLDNKESVDHALNQIKVASIRGRDIVSQLLSFSRMDETRKQVLGVGDVLQDAVAMLRISIDKDIRISLKADEDCSPIRGNPTQIHQIVLNLCNNAAHAMEDAPGTISIRAQNIRMDKKEVFFDRTLEPGPYVRLTVSDTGPGIPREIQDRVFDPFYSTKSIDKGSGMGLAVVLGIINNHDAGIRIHSQPGAGTRVECCFPAVDQMPDQVSSASETFLGGHGHLFFVDDESALAQVGKKRLERIGYQVSAFTSPLLAVEAFEKDPDRVDLVVTDMSMPDMTGDLLMKRILAVRPELPVILCTGYSQKMDEKRAQLAGAAAFMMKPVDFNELARAIERILTR